MTNDLPELLQRIAGKGKILSERYGLVKQQRDEARQQCAELLAEIERLRAQLQQANTEIEYLKISHKIAPTEQDSRQAQVVLTEMVKKIDKCIARLRSN